MRELLPQWGFALPALWNGYVVMLHASAFGLVVAAFAPWLRRRSASAEASAYASALCGMLGVSLLCWLPGVAWRWWLPRGVSEPLFWIGSTNVAATNGAPQVSVYLVGALYLVWIAGSVACLVRLGVGYATLEMTARRSRAVSGTEWREAIVRAARSVRGDLSVDVRVSDAVAVPMTCGMIDPVILLPADSVAWTDAEREFVIAHEMAHIRRHDSLIQFVAQLTHAWYWFHPGVWWTERRLRAARERAADAIVIAGGARRSEYAAFLMRAGEQHTLTAAFGGAPGLPFIGRGSLASRVKAVLDSRGPAARSPVTSRPASLAAIAVVATWMGIAGMIRLAPMRSVAEAELQSESWSRRAYAVEFLSRTKSVTVRAMLARLARHDPHPVVRRAARRTLSPRS